MFYGYYTNQIDIDIVFQIRHTMYPTCFPFTQCHHVLLSLFAPISYTHPYLSYHTVHTPNQCMFRLFQPQLQPLYMQYGVDQTRFFLMSEVNFGSDGDFSHEKLARRVNTNLANELGNLCQRTLSMVYKNCNKAIPIISSTSTTASTNSDDDHPLTEEDTTLLSKARSLRHTCAEAISQQQIHRYVEAITSIVWDANKYIDEMEPWALKQTDLDRMKTVLYVILEVLRVVAILYQPLIPASANEILDQLAVPTEERGFEDLEKGGVRMGEAIEKPVPIFPRIDLDEIEDSG